MRVCKYFQVSGERGRLGLRVLGGVVDVCVRSEALRIVSLRCSTCQQAFPSLPPRHGT